MIDKSKNGAGGQGQQGGVRIDDRAPAAGYIDPIELGGMLKSSTATRAIEWSRPLASARTPSSPATVAVVDDRIEVQELLAIRLGMVAGLQLVGQGYTGSEAVELARSVSPDLMILDLQMPVMGGAEAIPLLRALCPQMRIVIYTSDPGLADLSGANRPDAIVLKGGNLGYLMNVVERLLAESPNDQVQVDLGRLPVQVAVHAFDSWVGLNTRVRHALATKGDLSADLLGDVLPLNSSELLSLMGVFMQFGMPVMAASAAGETEVDLRFMVNRAAGAAARRALLALGGNGTLRAFNKAWSHSPTKEAEQALDLVDRRLVEQLPVSQAVGRTIPSFFHRNQTVPAASDG
jgi:CheY-like chemotaxis protein